MLAGRLLVGALGVTLLLLARAPRLADAAGVVLPRAHGVVSESDEAARDALGVLDRGGSAADAAIVAALVSGVTAPSSSGIGGGGFAMVWDQKSGRMTALDFREVAPRAVNAEALERRPLADEERGHLVGVPGEVRGLYELHRRAGKLPWSTLVEVAAKRARVGFTVAPHLGEMLGFGQKVVGMRAGFAELYYPGSVARQAGSRMTNPVLATTLSAIASGGPAAYYEGTIADDLIAAVRAAGGTLTREDLRDYQVKERPPLKVRYAGRDVYTMPAPSAGGLLLAEVLSMFPPDELETLGHGTAAYEHLLGEAMRGAFYDRMRYVGDPDHEPVDYAKLLEPARLEARKRTFGLDRTHGIPAFAIQEHGTHHLVAADRQGNVVSLTTTVNRLFGAKLLDQKTGVVLNDQLDDFSQKTDAARVGLTESPNRPRPGARPVSSMTPTIVVTGGRASHALGGSGGTAIGTNVTQVLLSFLVFGQTPSEAVRAPRVYVPLDGRTLLVEKKASAEHVADLAWRGELVGEMPFDGTAVQALAIDDEGQVLGAADPRKHGGTALR